VRRIITIATALIALSSTLVDARHRAETYIDNGGVKRHVKTGKIYRDYKAVIAFKKKNPRPKDGHAYDIDHIKPLKRGGADTPTNMQWIRTEEHRRKSH
jgi:hypothetical protein